MESEGVTPEQAAYEAYWANREPPAGTARHIPANWDDEQPARRDQWEAAATAGVAAYIKANGRDPVDLSSVVAEALAEKRIAVDGELRTAWSERAGLDTAEAGVKP